MINILNQNELEILSNLIGERLNYFGGPDLSHLFISNRCLISIGERIIEVQGIVFFDSIQGFDNEFSRMQIGLAAKESVSSTRSHGNEYMFLSGQVCTAIEVIEETIDANETGSKRWTYITDVAFVLHFPNGSLAISKLGHHDEALKISILDSGAIGEIPATEHFFENDLFVTHRITRRTLSLEAALRRVSQSGRGGDD